MPEMLRLQKEKKDIGSLQNMVMGNKYKKRSSLCHNIDYKKKKIEVTKMKI